VTGCGGAYRWLLDYRAVNGPIVNHDCARSQIAKALIPRREEDRECADGVDCRELIDDPQQVAQDRIEGAYRPAGLDDDAESDPALAWRLSVPERFECREVPVLKTEAGEDRSE